MRPWKYVRPPWKGASTRWKAAWSKSRRGCSSTRRQREPPVAAGIRPIPRLLQSYFQPLRKRSERRCQENQPMIPAHAPAPVKAPRTRRRTVKGLALLASACCLVLAPGQGAQKKTKPKKEEITQVLQLPKELPGAVTGETRRLTFHVTPLSSHGLLSAQVRDSLKALTRETGGNPVLKIRAFVAGSGDLRRVRDLVSEVFTDRRLPLPALSLIQSGGLPLEGAQVILDAIAAGKKEVSPHGLVFLSAPIATSGNPLDPVAPLAAQSLDRLKRALKTAGSEPSDVVRVT